MSGFGDRGLPTDKWFSLHSFLPKHTQHRAHSTQHTADSTQHTAHSTQHTAHSTQHTEAGWEGDTSNVPYRSEEWSVRSSSWRSCRPTQDSDKDLLFKFSLDNAHFTTLSFQLPLYDSNHFWIWRGIFLKCTLPPTPLLGLIDLCVCVSVEDMDRSIGELNSNSSNRKSNIKCFECLHLIWSNTNMIQPITVISKTICLFRSVSVCTAALSWADPGCEA